MKKRFTSLLLALLLLFSLSATTFAMATPPTEAMTESESPRADEIIAYYRVNNNGLLEMRRWNATRGYWIDDDWFVIGTPTPSIANWLVVEIDGTHALIAPN